MEMSEQVAISLIAATMIVSVINTFCLALTMWGLTTKKDDEIHSRQSAISPEK